MENNSLFEDQYVPYGAVGRVDYEPNEIVFQFYLGKLKKTEHDGKDDGYLVATEEISHKFINPNWASWKCGEFEKLWHESGCQKVLADATENARKAFLIAAEKCGIKIKKMMRFFKQGPTIIGSDINQIGYVELAFIAIGEK